MAQTKRTFIESVSKRYRLTPAHAVRAYSEYLVLIQQYLISSPKVKTLDTREEIDYTPKYEHVNCS